jgi:hypothetical protein
MRGPLIGEGFPTSIGQGNKIKEGSWRGLGGVPRGKKNILCFGKLRRRMEV